MKKKSQWIKIEEPYDIPEGEEVIGYNPAWIDEALIPTELVSGSLLKSGSHQQSGLIHRIVTALVQKRAMIMTFFKKIEKAK